MTAETSPIGMATHNEDTPGYGGMRIIALLSVSALAAMLQLAILPSLTQLSEHFSSKASGAFDGPAIAQIVTTISALTLVLGAPVAGWLAQRIGKRPVFLGSAVSYAAFGVAGAFAPDLWTLFALRMLLGLSSAGLATMGMSLVGDYYTREKRDRVIGWFGVAGTGAALVTLVVAGQLAQLSWRAPFALYLIGLLVFVIALSSIKEPVRNARPTAISNQASIRAAAVPLALMLILGVGSYMVTVQGPFLLVYRGIADPGAAAAIAISATASGVVGAYFFGRLRSRFSFKWLLALIWLGIGIGTVGIGFSSAIGAFIGFAAISGFASSLTGPLMQSTILNVVPPAAAGRAIGLSVSCIFLAQFIHPFAIAPLRAAVGIQGTFLWVGAIFILAGFATLFWRRAALEPSL
ncbi:MAG TPA: MFS transporter [Alphaproteobacteria bacterium]|nr:MFS transporter [Alphaproteobacteria bacterium]